MSEEKCGKIESNCCDSENKNCCTKNTCPINSLIRAVVGLSMLAFAVGILGGDLNYRWIGWFGIFPLMSALIGFCPVNLLLKKMFCCKKDSSCNKNSCEGENKTSCSSSKEKDCCDNNKQDKKD